jgi:hypothetical protein
MSEQAMVEAAISEKGPGATPWSKHRRRACGNDRGYHSLVGHGLIASQHPRLPSVGRFHDRLRCCTPACDDLSHHLRRIRQLHRCPPRSQSLYAACHDSRLRGLWRKSPGRCSNLERRPGLRASLVSRCPRRPCSASRMGRRETPPRTSERNFVAMRNLAFCNSHSQRSRSLWAPTLRPRLQHTLHSPILASGQPSSGFDGESHADCPLHQH